MAHSGLQVAGSQAFGGFIAENYGKKGRLDDSKAGTYFTEHLQKELNRPVIIHDREHPQPPPQTYIPGQPTALHFGVPLSDGYDPGVYAVSTALFAGSGAFKPIPIAFKPVFRRRQRGDCLSEWSNAFVSRVDPCECQNPEETYTPYEVARYRDQIGRVHTTLDFSS